MSTITQEALVIRVLKYLKVYDAGASVSADDDATVDEAIEDVHEELQQLELAYWDLDAIPQAVVRGLVMVVAADVADSFVHDEGEILRYEGRRPEGLRRIRAVLSRLNTHDTNPHPYF